MIEENQMEIRTLSTFIKVAEEQSLSKAAKQLGYAQSTVTMQMQQLEQELGISLYERVGKQIRITQEGQEFLQYAVHIVKTSQEALQVGKGKRKTISGTLRLGIADSIGEEWLAALLQRYVKACPEVHIHVRSGDSRSLTRLLLCNEIDLMMVLDHRINDPVLVHAHDRAEAVHFIAAPTHPLTGIPSLTLAEILAHPLIRGEAGSPCERDLEAAMAAAGVVPAHPMEIENRALILRLAEYSAGITLLPDCTVQNLLHDGRLMRLDYELPGAGLWQQTIYHKNKWLTGAMNEWIKMLEEAE